MNPPAVIRVTADHIARGERSLSSRCPIARAIAEQSGFSLDDIAVGPDEASILNFEVWFRARLPLTAYAFIRDFDDGQPVKPFEFAAEWTGPDWVAA
jgi:hypothetical protein